MSLEDAQKLIMTARIQLGWVDISELEAEDATDTDEDETEE
ncbi:N utilization substance protein A [Rhodobacter capsulatus]|nr:N utilization substance protein A [Rhodobacter capsulatus]